MNSFNQKHVPEYWEHRSDPTLAIPEYCHVPVTEKENLEELSQADEIATVENDFSNDLNNQNSSAVENDISDQEE